MAARTRRLAAAALAIGLLGGCAASKPMKYYRLTNVRDSAPAGEAEPLPITLVVGTLTTSRMYREDRIVYGDGHEMGAYQYQRWADPPTEMIEQVLLRRLRSSGRYQAVYYKRSNTTGDYELRGRLQDFHEVTGNPLRARMTLELELRDVKSGRTVWTHDYAHDEPVDKKDVHSVVAALDRNAQQAVSEVVASLEQYFASRGAAR